MWLCFKAFVLKLLWFKPIRCEGIIEASGEGFLCCCLWSGTHHGLKAHLLTCQSWCNTTAAMARSRAAHGGQLGLPLQMWESQKVVCLSREAQAHLRRCEECSMCSWEGRKGGREPLSRTQGKEQSWTVRWSQACTRALPLYLLGVVKLLARLSRSRIDCLPQSSHEAEQCELLSTGTGLCGYSTHTSLFFSTQHLDLPLKTIWCLSCVCPSCPSPPVFKEISCENAHHAGRGSCCSLMELCTVNLNAGVDFCADFEVPGS